MKGRTKALFLDRDGTIIRHIPYLHDPESVELIEGAREALAGALKTGFRLFLFTNQSGVGRGMYTMDAVVACNDRMLELLQLPGEGFSRVCVAPEEPGDNSGYRKPNPRFIVEMIDEYQLDPDHCWMMGDSDCDMDAAANAGIHGCRIGENRSLARVVPEIINRYQSE